ncbi:MAG: hypothetical protein WCA16_07970 [Candidatus Sulfotelmatobacter sp.]
MSEAKKLLGEAEFLSADLSTLTTDDLTRRAMSISLRKAERELEQVSYENEKVLAEKKERQRVAEMKTENIRAERERRENEQRGFQHKTGGEGLLGFFNGDGNLYGYSVAPHVLPTGELYFLCFRCQREWHIPSKRAVLEGKMTLLEYRQQEAQYSEVYRWPKKTFQPIQGEFPAASQFNIPRLTQQRQRDDADSAAHLILLHQSLELTARDQIAPNVIQPDGLSTVLELF